MKFIDILLTSVEMTAASIYVTWNVFVDSNRSWLSCVLNFSADPESEQAMYSSDVIK